MKAIHCQQFGPPSDLVFIDADEPICGEHQVLIQNKACSLNFPDTLIIQGKYQFSATLPFSPGSEFAGVIEKVGEQVKHLKAGDEVIVLDTHGGLAEKSVVDAIKCIPKPSGMNMEMASAFLYTYSTSYYALKQRANIQEGETVLVLGASGGIGISSIEIAKMLGATVIAAASTKEKLDLCAKHGADHLINYEEENLKKKVKELTLGKGVNIIVDPVGGKYAEPSLRAIAWEGRYLVIGFTTGEIPKFPLNLALLKSCQIVGVFLGGFVRSFPKQGAKMMGELMQCFATQKLQPYIHQTFNLEQAPKALEMMANRKAMGKLVVKI